MIKSIIWATKKKNSFFAWNPGCLKTGPSEWFIIIPIWLGKYNPLYTLHNEGIFRCSHVETYVAVTVLPKNSVETCQTNQEFEIWTDSSSLLHFKNPHKCSKLPNVLMYKSEWCLCFFQMLTYIHTSTIMIPVCFQTSGVLRYPSPIREAKPTRWSPVFSSIHTPHWGQGLKRGADIWEVGDQTHRSCVFNDSGS